MASVFRPRSLARCYFLTLTFCFDFFKAVILSKKNKIYKANVLFLLLPHFCTYFFTPNSAVFVGGSRKNILPPGVGYPNYATEKMFFKLTEVISKMQ